MHPLEANLPNGNLHRLFTGQSTAGVTVTLSAALDCNTLSHNYLRHTRTHAK